MLNSNLNAGTEVPQSDAAEVTTSCQTIAKPVVIGCVYGQTITGTLFKQKVINCQGGFNNKDYHLVENIETGFRHTIAGCDLHSL